MRRRLRGSLHGSLRVRSVVGIGCGVGVSGGVDPSSGFGDDLGGLSVHGRAVDMAGSRPVSTPAAASTMLGRAARSYNGRNGNEGRRNKG